jgi:hypothetical protein
MSVGSTIKCDGYTLQVCQDYVELTKESAMWALMPAIIPLALTIFVCWLLKLLYQQSAHFSTSDIALGTVLLLGTIFCLWMLMEVLKVALPLHSLYRKGPDCIFVDLVLGGFLLRRCILNNPQCLIVSQYFNRGSHAFQVKIRYGVNSSYSVTIPTSISHNERKRVGLFFNNFALAIGIDNVVHSDS